MANSTFRKSFAVALMAAFGFLQSAFDKEAAAVMDNTITRDQLKVATFNIRLDYAGDGANNWHKRKEAVVSFLKSEDMHIVGMQEVLDNQFQFLKNNLPGYQAIGIGREDGATKGEYSLIFCRIISL